MAFLHNETFVDSPLPIFCNIDVDGRVRLHMEDLSDVSVVRLCLPRDGGGAAVVVRGENHVGGILGHNITHERPTKERNKLN